LEEEEILDVQHSSGLTKLSCHNFLLGFVFLRRYLLDITYVVKRKTESNAEAVKVCF